jgi:hypothetical protein
MTMKIEKKNQSRIFTIPNVYYHVEFLNLNYYYFFDISTQGNEKRGFELVTFAS